MCLLQLRSAPATSWILFFLPVCVALRGDFLSEFILSHFAGPTTLIAPCANLVSASHHLALFACFALFVPCILSSRTKRCAAPGCKSTFFIGDFHLDALNTIFVKRPDFQVNPDGVPCAFVVTRACYSSGSMKTMSGSGLAVEIPPVLQFVVFITTTSQPSPSPMKAPFVPPRPSSPPRGICAID